MKEKPFSPEAASILLVVPFDTKYYGQSFQHLVGGLKLSSYLCSRNNDVALRAKPHWKSRFDLSKVITDDDVSLSIPIYHLAPLDQLSYTSNLHGHTFLISSYLAANCSVSSHVIPHCCTLTMERPLADGCDYQCSQVLRPRGVAALIIILPGYRRN
jgi:hypothetical protein